MPANAVRFAETNPGPDTTANPTTCRVTITGIWTQKRYLRIVQSHLLTAILSAPVADIC